MKLSMILASRKGRILVSWIGIVPIVCGCDITSERNPQNKSWYSLSDYINILKKMQNVWNFPGIAVKN